MRPWRYEDMKLCVRACEAAARRHPDDGAEYVLGARFHNSTLNNWRTRRIFSSLNILLCLSAAGQLTRGGGGSLVSVLSVAAGRRLRAAGAHRPRPHLQHRARPLERSKRTARQRRPQQVRIIVRVTSFQDTRGESAFWEIVIISGICHYEMQQLIFICAYNHKVSAGS